MTNLKSQGKLPSQTNTNLKQNASAINLRSGRELEFTAPKSHSSGTEKGAKIKAEFKEDVQPKATETV